MAEHHPPPPPAYNPMEFQPQIVLPPGFVPLPPGFLPPGFVPPGYPVGPNGVPLPMPPPIMNSITGEIIFPMVPNMPPVGPNGIPLGIPPGGEAGHPPPGFPFPPPGFFPGPPVPMGFDPNMTPQQGAPHQGAPHQGAPHQGAPHQGAPHQGVPHQGVPHQGVPHQGAPHQGVPHGAPIQLGKTEQPHHNPISFEKDSRAQMEKNSSSVPRSEVGWGHIDPVSPNNRYAHMIVCALKSNHHQLSPERLNWLYYWTGANILDEFPNSPDISVQTMKFNSRLNFLKDSWANEFFRPFETIASAEGMIKSHRAYVIRLSTSTPGCIAITRWNDQYNQPSHKRFEIDSHSRLVGDNQVYANIAEFSKSFAAGIKPRPQ